MFKFRIEGETRTLIGLGLTPGNIKRMQANDPVLVKLDVLGIEPGHSKPVDVMIMAGESETEIIQAMEEQFGFEIGPGTVVRLD